MRELLRVTAAALVDTMLTLCGRKDLALARYRRPTENLQGRASLRCLDGSLAIMLPDAFAKRLRFHNEVTIELLGTSLLIEPGRDREA